MTEEKLQAALLKIRKGSVASIKLHQWIEILNSLGGWRVEPAVALISSRGYTDEKDQPQFDTFSDAASAERAYQRMRENFVTSKPTRPELRQRIYTELQKPQEASDGRWFVYYREFVGVACYEFTSPEGKTFQLTPTIFDSYRFEHKKLEPYRLWDWLKAETKIKEQASNRLGLETHEAERARKTQPKARSGAGTCPCCFRNIKLKERPDRPEMVLHGYQRPGWGQVEGRCFGVGYPPFEISTEGTEHLVKHLEIRIAQTSGFLRKLKGGEITSLGVAQHRTMRLVEQGDPDWEQTLESRIKETERTLTGLQSDIRMLDKLIREWKQQPLPEVGQAVKKPPAFLR